MRIKHKSEGVPEWAQDQWIRRCEDSELDSWGVFAVAKKTKDKLRIVDINDFEYWGRKDYFKEVEEPILPPVVDHVKVFRDSWK